MYALFKDGKQLKRKYVTWEQAYAMMWRKILEGKASYAIKEVTKDE